MYSTTTRQKKKLNVIKSEAMHQLELLANKIAELENEIETLNNMSKEYYRIECAATNMLNGVIEYNDKILTLNNMQKN